MWERHAVGPTIGLHPDSNLEDFSLSENYNQQSMLENNHQYKNVLIGKLTGPVSRMCEITSKASDTILSGKKSSFCIHKITC